MEADRFSVLLQVIVQGLVKKIIDEKGLDGDTVIEKLYTSELYATLENEKTKVWHYSVPMLYDLWERKMETGTLVLPEY